jgi:hypothetical protein
LFPFHFRCLLNKPSCRSAQAWWKLQLLFLFVLEWGSCDKESAEDRIPTDRVFHLSVIQVRLSSDEM